MLQIPEQVKTASPWHRDVQNHQVPSAAPHLGQYVSCIPGFVEYCAIDIASQDLFQSPAQDGMVVGNKNTCHWPISDGDGWISRVTTLKVVPFPHTLAWSPHSGHSIRPSRYQLRSSRRSTANGLHSPRA